MNLQAHFSRFLGAAPGRLHFAAHSHHPWPDASFEAHQQAWLDAARHADLKWDKVFGEVMPQAQAHVARTLGLPDASTICFAPSTHELVMRLVSAIDARPLRVLTTDGEFHSFSRQMRRLEEGGLAQVQRVPVAPFDTFTTRFAEAAAAGGQDLVYFSQCFYNTGYLVRDLDALVAAVPDPRTLVAIDGYHGYMAVPTDLSRVAARAFYTAGGYKYAMCGEGACFLHCPPGYAPRPLHTGWFAGFGALAQAQDSTEVPYAEDGLRFMGSTYDPTPLYRLNAVMAWLQREGVTVGAIRQHVQALQQRFLERIARDGLLRDAELTPPAGMLRGNFLVFRHAEAGAWHRRLLDASVVTDFRGDRLRFGFGLYQVAADVDACCERIAALDL